MKKKTTHTVEQFQNIIEKLEASKIDNLYTYIYVIAPFHGLVQTL